MFEAENPAQLVTIFRSKEANRMGTDAGNISFLVTLDFVNNANYEMDLSGHESSAILCVYPRHTGGAVPLRCLCGINRSGTAMTAVVPQWFRH